MWFLFKLITWTCAVWRRCMKHDRRAQNKIKTHQRISFLVIVLFCTSYKCATSQKEWLQRKDTPRYERCLLLENSFVRSWSHLPNGGPALQYTPTRLKGQGNQNYLACASWDLKKKKTFSPKFNGVTKDGVHFQMWTIEKWDKNWWKRYNP